MELKSDKIIDYLYLKNLLIVPYGIEMYSDRRIGQSERAFNRTLWN